MITDRAFGFGWPVTKDSGRLGQFVLDGSTTDLGTVDLAFVKSERLRFGRKAVAGCWLDVQELPQQRQHFHGPRPRIKF